MINNLGDLWQRLSLIQRIMLLGVVLACLGAAAVLMGWARRPDMRLLYNGLAPEDAARIVEKLNDSDIRYELKNGGTTVFVDKQHVYSTRLAMASEGLPNSSHAGYRILDDEKIGTSPFSQRVNFTRAIEGEVATTVELMESVVSARVHIARSDSAVFSAKAGETSATVALRLKSGRRLTGQNVAAIVNLLAGSVDGLKADKVVVVDSQGNLLSGEADNELAGKAGTFLDYKSQVESYLAHKAEDMLTAVLGPDRATVQVDASIDTTNVNETTETYDPVNRVVVKEEIKSKSSTPTGVGKNGEGGGNSTKDEETFSEYLVSRTVQQKADLPGKVNSLSVAVLVDLTPAKSADGNGPAAPMPTVQDVQDLVTKALGLKDPDSIKVATARFYQPSTLVEDTEVADEGLFTKDLILEIARRSSLGILVIGALLALKIFGKSKGAKQWADQSVPALQGVGGQSDNLLPAQEADPNQLRNHISRALQDNPEEVKRLFVNWVENDKEEA